MSRPRSNPRSRPTPTRNERPRSAFRHRDFALYWVALVTESFGLEMALVAIGWQVYSVRGNPLDLGLIGLAEFVPLLAFAIRPFFILAFLFGVGSTIGAPAGRALTPSLVPQDLLVRALAQRSVAFQLSRVAGPAVGGLLFTLSAELVYVVALGLAMISLGCILALHAGRVAATEGGTGVREALAGVRLIRRTKVLLGAISLDLCAVLFGGAVALLPIFAKDVLEVGPTGLGFMRTAPAIGALLAAFWLARRPIRRHAGPTLFRAVAAFGASMVVFGLSSEMWLSMLALGVGGAVDMVSVVLRATILPLVTPDSVRGRVNAVEMVFISASNELGAFESGVAAALIGAVPAVVVGGIATIVVAGVWWRLFPALGRVDRLDELRPIRVLP